MSPPKPPLHAGFVELEVAAPAAPVAGKVRLYLHSDGSLHARSSSTDAAVGGGGGGGLPETPLAVAHGGTAATTPTDARAALGAAAQVIWPGVPATPGVKAAVTWLVAASGGLQSGKTILDVQMPGGSGLHRILYTNKNGDYPTPPAPPIGVQVDQGPPDIIASCGLPIHVTGGGDGFMVISLTTANVNGGLFACNPAKPVNVNLDPAGTGTSTPFFGGAPGVEASAQLNFSGSPGDGWLFDITVPGALGGGTVHFYMNHWGTYTHPSTGTWVDIDPPLGAQIAACDLPLDWTVTEISGMPGSTTIIGTARYAGTIGNGGTVSTDYPMATINGGASPGSFIGGTEGAAAVPAAPYPDGTATKIAKADGTAVDVVDGVVPEAAHAATATSATTAGHATTADSATNAGTASFASTAAAVNHTLTVAEGGTNASTAHDARASLGIPDLSQKLTGCLSGAVTPGVTQYLTPSGAPSLVPVPLIIIDGTGVKIDNLKTTLGSAPGSGAGPRTHVTTVIVSTDLGASWADTALTCTATGTDNQPSDNTHSYTTSSAPVLVGLKSVANDDGGNSAAYVASTFRITHLNP